MAIVEKRGFCALCKSRCGAIFEVDGDHLVSARADPEHPTGSAFCIKSKAAPEIVANRNRLLHPMRRTNPKTDPDPGWRRISWDEALSEVAARLSEIRERAGPEAVAFALTTPSGTAISDDIVWIERFIRSFGSPNTIYSTEICNWHKDNAHAFTFGSALPQPDFARADTVMLWGWNPSTTWLEHAAGVAAAKRRGAKLIVVDLRRAGAASKADHWLRVRPGGDLEHI